MNGDINTIIFYLADKNDFNGISELRYELGPHINFNSALAEIEDLGIVFIRYTRRGFKEYKLKEDARKEIQSLPTEYKKNPFSYFKNEPMPLKTSDYRSNEEKFEDALAFIEERFLISQLMVILLYMIKYKN